MRIVTPAQMSEIDRCTIEEIGIPGIVLMENASIKVVAEIQKIFNSLSNRHISVFAGKGNNGGDAFAVARHLYNNGARVSVFLVFNKDETTNDAGKNLSILEKLDIEIIELTQGSSIQHVDEILRKTDLIVDGILGTGVKGKLRGTVKKVVEAIVHSGKHVIAIDIPTGINGETGEVLGTCVKAYKTVTFGLPKVGLMIHPGCEYTGELIVADIGFPKKVIDNMNIKTNLIDKKYASKLMPERHGESNKGDYGRVFIIAGSLGMTGAGCLTASAALRTGSGLVYIGVPAILTNIYDAALVEAITVPLEDEGKGYLAKGCISQVLERLQRATVAAIGPGLSTAGEIKEIIRDIIIHAATPLVLDADALNAIASDVSILSKLRTQAVITPHPGEMARLAGISIEDVQNNRIDTARDFSAKWGVITVLKGSRTIVANPESEVYININGNPGMATGGTGDVLTGIIAGLIGQGLKPMDAAAAGVYIHGLAGDQAAVNKGEHGLIASDLVEELPSVIKSLIKQ